MEEQEESGTKQCMDWHVHACCKLTRKHVSLFDLHASLLAQALRHATWADVETLTEQRCTEGIDGDTEGIDGDDSIF